MTNLENTPEQPLVDQQHSRQLPESCLHCPILQYCLVEIEAIQELPASSETKAIVSSYVRFYSGVLVSCNAGIISEPRKRFFVAGPNVVKISCGSAQAKQHRDIRTVRTPEIK